MRRFINGLVLGILLSAAGFWFIQMKALQRPEAQQRDEEAVAKPDDASNDVSKASNDVMDVKLDTLDLRANQITTELAKKGEIVRRKAHDIGDQAVSSDSDSRAAAEIKAKYAADAKLSAWNISINCAQGHVTLIGAVASADDIGKAIALALEPDGVRDVTSTLQIKPSQ